MLTIIYGNAENSIYNTNVYFKNTYEPEWIESELAKKIIKDVDDVSAKYSCGFPDSQVSFIIVVDRYLDYFTTIMEDRLWQVLAKPVFRWQNKFGLSMNAAKAA